MTNPGDSWQERNVPISLDTAITRPAPPAHLLLDTLLRKSVVRREDWESLPADARDRLRQQTESNALLQQLVERALLTDFQAGRIRAGRTSGLLFGNYRVLDCLGSGGMGVVFKAEHLFMRRLVALKVLPGPFGDDPMLQVRFLSEIRNVAKLRHPNIVAALDAGRTQGSDLELADCYYMVMEYVPGSSLEQEVRRNGPLAAALACDLACQVASALAEAHKQGLIHRDIKPSNVLVTPEGQAKLLDFGLALGTRDRRVTDPGTVLGSLDYMAPEQASPGQGIDHRADIYALGGVLYWCLTGKPPFPARTTLAEELVARQTQSAPPLRQTRPDLPAELETVLSKMMAQRPEERYPTAQAVVSALLPFLRPQSSPSLLPSGTVGEARLTAPVEPAPSSARVHQVLIADDEPVGRRLCRRVLEQEGIACDEVVNGAAALEAVRLRAYDLVLLDIHMPEVEGPEVLRRLRETPPSPNLKVIMLSGQVSPDEMAALLAAGADDYLPKPPSAAQLLGRVKAALSLKDAQDRTDVLNRHLLAVNAELERSLRASAGDLAESRNALLLALAELAERRAGQTEAHLLRVRQNARLLAEEAAGHPAFAGQIDANFIAMLECCSPLHDIGLSALPDHVLRKAGKFDHDERLIMQTHASIGADMLQGIARRHHSALALLQMAADIARHHHENWDGTGYPDRLAGNAIPLCARIVAVADVYDALRSRRPHRPALAHLFAVELMTEGSPGRFDPHLVPVFRTCAARMDQTVHEFPDPGGY